MRTAVNIWLLMLMYLAMVNTLSHRKADLPRCVYCISSFYIYKHWYHIFGRRSGMQVPYPQGAACDDMRSSSHIQAVDCWSGCFTVTWHHDKSYYGMVRGCWDSFFGGRIGHQCTNTTHTVKGKRLSAIWCPCVGDLCNVPKDVIADEPKPQPRHETAVNSADDERWIASRPISNNMGLHPPTLSSVRNGQHRWNPQKKRYVYTRGRYNGAMQPTMSIICLLMPICSVTFFL